MGLRRAAVMALAASRAASAQEDPRAACVGTRPGAAECCYSDLGAPVLGGIDFVDLASKSQGRDAPAFGSAAFVSHLNGYEFRFGSASNAATFAANPWRYAPSWGGF